MQTSTPVSLWERLYLVDRSDSIRQERIPRSPRRGYYRGSPYSTPLSGDGRFHVEKNRTDQCGQQLIALIADLWHGYAAIDHIPNLATRFLLWSKQNRVLSTRCSICLCCAAQSSAPSHNRCSTTSMSWYLRHKGTLSLLYLCGVILGPYPFAPHFYCIWRLFLHRVLGEKWLAPVPGPQALCRLWSMEMGLPL